MAAGAGPPEADRAPRGRTRTPGVTLTRSTATSPTPTMAAGPTTCGTIRTRGATTVLPTATRAHRRVPREAVGRRPLPRAAGGLAGRAPSTGLGRAPGRTAARQPARGRAPPQPLVAAPERGNQADCPKWRKSASTASTAGEPRARGPPPLAAAGDPHGRWPVAPALVEIAAKAGAIRSLAAGCRTVECCVGPSTAAPVAAAIGLSLGERLGARSNGGRRRPFSGG